MNLQESIRRILREDKYDDKVGRIFWFEYHCYESPESCDAEIWYRSHQKVKVIGVSEWSFDDYEDRMNDGQPRVYLVEWKDGFQYDVFEDELLESPNEFYRPNPPKRKIQESIRRILREEAGLPLYLKRRIGIREIEHDFNMLINFEIKSIKNRDLSLEEFKRMIVSTLMDIFHGALSDWGKVDFDYNYIYDSLMNYFSPRITEKYIEHLYNG